MGTRKFFDRFKVVQKEKSDLESYRAEVVAAENRKNNIRGMLESRESTFGDIDTFEEQFVTAIQKAREQSRQDLKVSFRDGPPLYNYQAIFSRSTLYVSLSQGFDEYEKFGIECIREIKAEIEKLKAELAEILKSFPDLSEEEKAVIFQS